MNLAGSSRETTQQDRTKGTAEQDRTKGTVEQGAKKADGALSATDRQFVRDAAADGMAEVELGRLATDRATNDDVKKFAQKMIDDHSKANDELTQLASQKGITVSKDLEPKHKALRDRLSKLSGAEFDRQYMHEMVNDHEKAVSKFRQEASNGKDSDLKTWASKTLPTLEDHLQMARDTAGKVGASTGSEKHPATKGKSTRKEEKQ